jgi:hypothetical protein
MSLGRLAARLLTPALAALLLVAAPSSWGESPDLRPTRAADPREALAVHLPGGDELLIMSRLTTSEVYRGIERLRLPSLPIAVAAVGCLLSGVLSWRSPARVRGSRGSLSPPRCFAGRRAPPLQLA